MSSKSILIMLASYNGENYIRQQIESIQHQSFENWTLIIQDDYSTDNTPEIVREMAKKDSRITFVNNDGMQHGPFINFHRLIDRCRELRAFDYYCFCDQDDIWMDDKLSFLITLFEDVDEPALAYANMDVLNASGQIVIDDFNERLGLKYVNAVTTFFSHNVFGCNTIFNRQLFVLLPKVNIAAKSSSWLSHDNFVTKCAAAYGRVIYSGRVTMHYRRHGGNVTSHQKYSFTLSRVLGRFFRFSSLAKDHARTYGQSLVTIQLLQSAGKESHLPLQQISQVLRSGGFSALSFVVKHRVSWGKPIKTLSHELVLMTGVYRRFLPL